MDASLPQGRHGNLNPSVIARLPEGKPWQSQPLCHCEASQQGRRGNLVLRLLRRYAPRNDNGIDCLCEASRREARGNLNPSVIASLPKGGVAIYFSDCFVATPLAMTMG